MIPKVAFLALRGGRFTHLTRSDSPQELLIFQPACSLGTLTLPKDCTFNSRTSVGSIPSEAGTVLPADSKVANPSNQISLTAKFARDTYPRGVAILLFSVLPEQRTRFRGNLH